jgi:hypothetical protein
MPFVDSLKYPKQTAAVMPPLILARLTRWEVFKMNRQIEKKSIAEIETVIEKTIESVIKIIFDGSKEMLSEAQIKLFPSGIDLIDVEVKVGPATATIFDFHLKIAGKSGGT